MGFRVGRVLTQTFSIFFRNIAPFGLLALVLTSPTYLYHVLVGPPDMGAYVQNPWGDSVAIILGILNWLLTYLVTAALVYGTLEDLRGNKVSVGECFSQGLARMFPVLGVAIVATIIMGIGLVILIVPGIIAIIMLWVAIPVAVVERRGLGSLSRSAQLTKGHRWQLFGLFLILLLIVFGVSFGFGALSAGIMIAGELSDAAFAGLLATQWLAGAVIAIFMAVLYAVSYHDLRVAKEGLDTNQIASVFD